MANDVGRNCAKDQRQSFKQLRDNCEEMLEGDTARRVDTELIGEVERQLATAAPLTEATKAKLSDATKEMKSKEANRQRQREITYHLVYALLLKSGHPTVADSIRVWEAMHEEMGPSLIDDSEQLVDLIDGILDRLGNDEASQLEEEDGSDDGQAPMSPPAKWSDESIHDDDDDEKEPRDLPTDIKYPKWSDESGRESEEEDGDNEGCSFADPFQRLVRNLRRRETEGKQLIERCDAILAKISVPCCRICEMPKENLECFLLVCQECKICDVKTCNRLLSNEDQPMWLRRPDGRSSLRCSKCFEEEVRRQRQEQSQRDEEEKRRSDEQSTQADQQEQEIDDLTKALTDKTAELNDCEQNVCDLASAVNTLVQKCEEQSEWISTLEHYIIEAGMESDSMRQRIAQRSEAARLAEKTAEVKDDDNRASAGLGKEKATTTKAAEEDIK